MALANATPRRPNGPAQRHGGWRCTIRSTPDTASDPLRVVIPGLSREHAWTVNHWQPHGGDLPIGDDIGLVVFDDRGEPWMLAWSAA